MRSRFAAFSDSTTIHPFVYVGATATVKFTSPLAGIPADSVRDVSKRFCTLMDGI
jgi:hypothetical protein